MLTATQGLVVIEANVYHFARACLGDGLLLPLLPVLCCFRFLLLLQGSEFSL